MIEYLDENFNLHVIDGENEAVPESWILIPKGADILVKSKNGLIFYKNTHDNEFSYCHLGGDQAWVKTDTKPYSEIGYFIESILWKRNKDQKLKEWLLKTEDGKYHFHRDDMDDCPKYIEKIEIPEGAIEARINGGGGINFINDKNGFMNALTNGRWVKYTHPNGKDCHKLVWQRKDESVVDAEFFPEEKKHSHYFKDVSHLDYIDVYRVLELFGVQEHAIGHAIKKLLVAGNRGAKNQPQDIQEAIDTLVRYQEMQKEDQK